MKKYLFDTQKLYTTATTNPTTGERHDIRLRFRPIDEDLFKEIGTLTITNGADNINWGYGLNTQRYATYGGEVIQILSTYADKMTIKGMCRNYRELTEIYEYFKSYIFSTTGIQDRERKQKYLLFEYPARNWRFVIMVADASGFRISRNVAAPEWSITAEVVSENDRYRLGAERIDQFANVLQVPVATGRRGRSGNSAVSSASRGFMSTGDVQDAQAVMREPPKNFQIDRAQQPFRTFIETTGGERGNIADNFDALIAAWAVGDISTIFSNPIAEPEKQAMEIWESRFGEGALLVSGGGGGSGTDSGTPLDGGAVGEGGIVWGAKQRMFGTVYGDAQNIDDNGLGAGGKILKDYPDSYAELATNAINYANQGQSSRNSYDAMGGLEFETPARVTNPKNGKSMILYKRDVGFGGNGPDGKRGTEDDPKIDIWWMAAKELGFDGWGWLEVEIGTPGQSVGSPAPTNISGTKREKAIEYAKWLIANEPKVFYTQDSRRLSYSSPQIPAGGMYTDCSASIVLCYQWAGASNPGASYTGDMLSSLQEISQSNAGPGDIIIYGSGTGDHAVMILEGRGSNFQVFSHGQDSGPVKTNWDYRSTAGTRFRRWPGVD